MAEKVKMGYNISMRKFIKVIAFCFLFLLSACTGAKRYVAYTIYPIGYLLNRIGGNKIQSISIQNANLVQVANIIPNYEEVLNDSSYLFYLGGIEPYWEIYEDKINATEAIKIDLSTLNAIYDFKRYTKVYANGVETFVESPYYNGDVFDYVDTNELDLSIWLDPIGMLSMAKDIYSTLAANYVEQSSTFTANYEQLEADLIALDASYQNLATRLKNENKTISFVTMTPNFGNWQKAYGFGIYPVCLSKYGALPGEEELAIIKKRIVDDGVKYIAYEPNMSDEMLELFDELESELGLERINLYNISSLTPSQIAQNKDYLSIMYENLNVLETIAADVEEETNQEENTTEETSEESLTEEEEANDNE